MSGWNERLGVVADRFDRLPLERRLLLFVGTLAALVLLWHQLWADPLWARLGRVQAQIGTVDLQVSALAAQVAAQTGQDSPALAMRREKETLEGELVRLDGYLRDATSNLVSPQQMATLLENLLRQQVGVRLVRLENLGTEPLFPGSATPGPEAVSPGPGLYRHAMRLEFQGSYLQTLSYLQQLEQLAEKLAWENLEIRIEEHPDARVVLTVYTLSLKRGWIGV